MIIVVGGKSAVSFGAAYGLVEMITVYTYMKTFMIVRSLCPFRYCPVKLTPQQLLGVYIVIFALGIPVYFLNSHVCSRDTFLSNILLINSNSGEGRLPNAMWYQRQNKLHKEETVKSLVGS